MVKSGGGLYSLWPVIEGDGGEGLPKKLGRVLGCVSRKTLSRGTGSQGFRRRRRRFWVGCGHLRNECSRDMVIIGTLIRPGVTEVVMTCHCESGIDRIMLRHNHASAARELQMRSFSTDTRNNRQFSNCATACQDLLSEYPLHQLHINGKILI